MSAPVSTPKEINCLVSFALAEGLIFDPDDGAQQALDMLREHLKATTSRYDHSAASMFPDLSKQVQAYVFTVREVPTLPRLLGMADDYRYTAEESDGWDESPTCALLDRIDARIQAGFARQFPHIGAEAIMTWLRSSRHGPSVMAGTYPVPAQH